VKSITSRIRKRTTAHHREPFSQVKRGLARADTKEEHEERRQRMPCLITVSGSRISLKRGLTYVVGRGLDCDLVVEDAACSRRHAQVTLDGDAQGAAIEDLGSRNGTFLNGEQVRGCRLAGEGGRIQIGASIFLLRLADEQAEIDLSETGTISYEIPSLRRDADGGELTAYGISGLLQLLHEGSRNVTVHVAMPDGPALLDVRGGKVLFADYAGLEGFNALVKLGRGQGGIFWLVETKRPCDRNVSEPTARLLSELKRCLDPAHPRV